MQRGMQNRCLAVPALLALLLRGIHLGFLAVRDPLFAHPVVDAWFHYDQAQQILATGWLLPGIGAFYKGPLYSYLLAILISLLGDSVGLIAARVLSVLLGTASVFLVARIARRLGGDRAAWIAGLAAAVYGTSIYFDVTLLLVPVVIFLLLYAGEKLILASECEAPEKPLALAGALLGLVTITRANGLLVVGAVALWTFALSRRNQWPGMQPVRAMGLVLIPALLVIAPVTVRNVFLEKDPVVVSWNGGINLYMGNDPAFEQDSGNWHPDLAWMRLYHMPEKIGLDRGSEHQRFFLRQTVMRTVRHPLRTAGILARKAGLLLGAYEISNNRRIDDTRRRSPLLALLMFSSRWFILPWSLFAPLIAAGLVFRTGPRVLARGALKTRGSVLVVMCAAWAITPLLFFNTARFRLPAVLLLIPLAAVGWAAFSSQRAKWPRTVVAAAVAGAVVFVLATVMIPTRPVLPLSDQIHLGEIAQRAGDDQAVIDRFSQAVEEDPSDPFARVRLGDWLGRLQRYEEAMPHFQYLMQAEGLAADWRNAALRSYARCLLELGRYDESIEAYQQFLADHPDNPVTKERPDFHLVGTPPLVACTHRLELLLAYERSGRREEALAQAGQVLADCADSEPLAAKAHSEIQRLSRR